jgi:hypothetical protein
LQHNNQHSSDVSFAFGSGSGVGGSAANNNNNNNPLRIGSDLSRLNELSNMAVNGRYNSIPEQRRGPAPILSDLLNLLIVLESDISSTSKKKNILVRVLKSFVELSKDSQCIPALIEASTMSTVIPFLKSDDEDVQTQVIMILWNVTRIAGANLHAAQARKEAAQSGAIPEIQRMIRRGEHRSMYFLVESICKFPDGAGKELLFEMKKHDMVQFYVNMTKSIQGILNIDALRALASWISHGDQYVPRLEFILCKPDNITQLIKVFRQPVANKKRKEEKEAARLAAEAEDSSEDSS